MKDWTRAKDWLAQHRAELRTDPAAFTRQYMQEPRIEGIEDWQKDAVKTIVGWDMATPGGGYTVRWNNCLGCYERRRAGERRWERMS